jgi:hypothetical protein
MTDYGDGSDGHVLCANGQSFDGLVQAKSFIVPYGVTVNIGTAGIPLIIRSQGAVIIAGTINGKGKGADDFERNGFNETIGWGDDGNSFVASVPVYKPGYGTGGGIGGRSGIMYARYTRTSAGGATVFNGKTFNLTTLPAGLISLIARRGTGAIGSMGGMMDDTTPDANYKGGDGGGGLVIVAPEILVAGFIDMSGTDGIALSSHNPLLGSRGYSSGGGGGGTVTMAARAVKVTGSVSVAGGLSPVPSGSNARPGQPGEDGWVKIFALGVM